MPLFVEDTAISLDMLYSNMADTQIRSWNIAQLQGIYSDINFDHQTSIKLQCGLSVWWNDLISTMVESGTPNVPSASHIATRRVVSLLWSVNRNNLHTHHKNLSEHLHCIQKPQCDSAVIPWQAVEVGCIECVPLLFQLHLVG